MTSIVTRLGRSEWSANQTSPHVPVNEGIALALVLATSLKGKDTDTPPGSPDEGDAYIVGATPTGAWSAFTPKNLAIYHNGAWVQVTAIDQLRVYVNDGGGNTDVWEYDGADWQLILEGGAGAFTGLTDTPANYTGSAGKLPAVNSGETALEFKATPYDAPVVADPDGTTANEVLARYTLCRNVDFPADFAGSQCTVETNPAATYDVDVRDDGTSIGTISISTGGSATFTTVGNTSKTVTAGSKLEFVGPDPADGSVAGISAMLRGSTVDL